MVLKGIFKFIEKIGKALGKALNFIVLGFVFWIPLGLTSIIGKMFGTKFLNKNPQGKSFWVNEKIEKKESETYYRMI